MAVGVTRNTRVASFVIEKALPKISNELARNDGIVAVLGAKGKIQTVNGGDLFEERVEYQENSNTAFRDKFAQIPTAQQDNWLTAKYGQAVLSGSCVVNQVELAQASGEYQISNLLDAIVENAKRTYVRKVADALRAASPAATDPESIRSFISTTAFGAQTGTTGNLNRATYSSWWQNQVSSTAADLSANTGVETVEAFYWNSVAKGSALQEQPDFGLTTGTLYAALSSFGDNQRQYVRDDMMQKLGFTSIKLLNAAIIADPSITSGYLYLLNTNYLRIQVLRTPGMQEVGDTPQSIPLSLGEMQKDIDTLNSVQLFYAVMNLTCCSLQRQGVLTNCS